MGERRNISISYLSQAKNFVEEADEEKKVVAALAKAMQECGLRFVIAPNDLSK